MASVWDYNGATALWQQEEDAVHRAYPIEVLRWEGSWRTGPYGAPRVDLPTELWSSYVTCRYKVFESGHVPSRLLTTCKYCGGPMEVVAEDSRGDLGRPQFRRIRVMACSCGWWNAEDEFRFIVNDDGSYDWQAMLSQGVLRIFHPAESDIPLHSLTHHLSRHPDDLATIDPYMLEKLVQAVLSDHFACEVHHVGRSGDGGIDLLVLDADVPRAVQVKRRSRDRAESVHFVREFLGALLLGGHKSGVFVSTAPRFSPPAEATARLAESLGLVRRFDLVDKNEFAAMVGLSAPNEAPWRHAAPVLDSPSP